MKENEVELRMAVVPQSFLDKIEEKIETLEDILRGKSEEEINSQWIESVKIPKLLGVSAKTWQTYRDKRLIPFSQIGSKIYVKREDLKRFMESHYIEGGIDGYSTSQPSPKSIRKGGKNHERR